MVATIRRAVKNKPLQTRKEQRHDPEALDYSDHGSEQGIRDNGRFCNLIEAMMPGGAEVPKPPPEP